MAGRAYTYPALFEDDGDGGFVVSFRDVPGANTQGDDGDEARANAADALAEMIASMINAGEPVPVATRVRKGEVAIQLDPLIALKAALNEAMIARKISNVVLGRRLGVKEGEVRRLRDPRHASKVRRLAQALDACDLVVSVAVGEKRPVRAAA